MESSPFRARRFAPADVRRILRRAAELAEQDAGTRAAERSLDQEEIERLGAELGLPATAVREAIAGSAGSEVEAGSAGDARVLTYEDELAGELPASRHEDVVDVIQRVMEGTGVTQVFGNTLTWTPPPPTSGNQPRVLSVRIRARDGVTRVRIEENLKQIYWGLYAGLTCGVGLSFGTAAFALTMGAHAPVLGALGAVLCLVASFALAHVIYRSLYRRRARQLTRLRAQLGEVVRQEIGASRKGARARIAAPGEEDAEAEAQAEEEAHEARRAQRGA
jgi:hypothetical protein